MATRNVTGDASRDLVKLICVEKAKIITLNNQPISVHSNVQRADGAHMFYFLALCAGNSP